MPRFAAARLALALAALLALPALGAAQEETAMPTPIATAADAAARAAAAFDTAFAGLLIRNPRSGETVVLPKLSAEDFRLIRETKAFWIVAAQPLAGPTVEARVSRAEGLVEFGPVTLADE